MVLTGEEGLLSWVKSAALEMLEVEVGKSQGRLLPDDTVCQLLESGT